ncbi:CAP domain-containing protein [Cryptosporangium minutisporangium]
MEQQRSSYQPRHRRADRVSPTPWRSAGGRGSARERAGFSTRSVLVLVVLAAIAVGAWIPWYLGRAGADTLQTAKGSPVSIDAPASQPVEAATTDPAKSGGDTASRSKRPAAAGPGATPTSAAPSASAAQSPSSAGSSAPTAEKSAEEPSTALAGPANESDQVIELVNTARAEAGCDPVHADSRLAAAALKHSEDMIARDYFAHMTPDGVSPWDRAKEAGYEVPTGENIALGQKDAAAVMDAWMNSAGHRANILNCASKAVGIGVATDSAGTPYWTQMFGAE